MNLDEFRTKRNRLLEEEKKEIMSRREVCPNCRRPAQACLCPFIIPIQTRAHFIILMHPKESRKIKNGTGRLAYLCLTNSEILEGVDFSRDRRLNSLLDSPKYSPVVLYPGSNSRDIANRGLTHLITTDSEPLVILIDGTWPEAKKMMKLSSNLHPVQRICIHPPQPSSFQIKTQPHKDCLATIEAAYYFLEEGRLQGIEKIHGEHKILMDIFKRMVDFQLHCMQDSSRKGYRMNKYGMHNSNGLSLKPQSRRLFFEDQ